MKIINQLLNEISKIKLLHWQIISAIITFIVYIQFMNYKTALLIIIGIGFHELGHIWAAKRMKLETGGFFTIPFVGGASLIRNQYSTHLQKTFVVLMGPIWGTFLGFVGFSLYYITHQIFWLRAAYWLFILNGFNLLPFFFLDGGQFWDSITISINSKLNLVVKVITSIIGVVLTFRYLNPIIGALFLYAATKQIVTYFKNQKLIRAGQTYLLPDDYFHNPRKLFPGQIILVSSIYLVLCITLFSMYKFLSHIVSLKELFNL